MDINIYASSVDPYNKLDWIPIDNIIELRKRFIICNIMVNVLIISIIIFATSIPDIIMELEHQLIWKYPSLTKTGQRTFLASGPRLCNNLAKNIKGLSFKPKFKSELHKQFV